MSAFERACGSLRWWMRWSDHPHAADIAAHYARYVVRIARTQGLV